MDKDIAQGLFPAFREIDLTYCKYIDLRDTKIDSFLYCQYTGQEFRGRKCTPSLLLRVFFRLFLYIRLQTEAVLILTTFIIEKESIPLYYHSFFLRGKAEMVKWHTRRSQHQFTYKNLW